MMQSNRSIKPLLIIIILTSFGMLAGALSAQHWLGWEPCTLCVQIRLWLVCSGTAGLLVLMAEQLGIRWAGLPFLAVLLVASGMAVYDNVHLLLIETGVIESTSCSPFPFYAFYFPLHEWMPDIFMSAGVCGENDYKIFGLPFSVWTCLSVTALFVFVVYTLIKALRR
ncbi:disulfide bond formation protein B [Ectopseudomonas mendocina]|uniref:Disulfide bond formation protein B n=1 Tax=Ectopseudomonas mendocina TaxID=300 RepID=A0ABZ2RL41_ECTME